GIKTEEKPKSEGRKIRRMGPAAGASKKVSGLTIAEKFLLSPMVLLFFHGFTWGAGRPRRGMLPGDLRHQEDLTEYKPKPQGPL
ncbi:MAG: hypothetical protein ACOVSI_08105, partial [Gemmatimonas sp.]